MSDSGRLPAQPSVVFAGCARDCDAHLKGVLENIERWSGRVTTAATVIVENDSKDGTRDTLGRWARAQPNRVLLTIEGLGSVTSRTGRLALARNAYLDFIAANPIRAADFLVVLDFDAVNSEPISEIAFGNAIGLLAQNPGVAAVFACSDPAYYDIWPLRHPEWCPGDVWVEVREERELPPALAVERYVYSRQVVIPETAQPIQVQSAFGGLGIYRSSAIQGARYDGVTASGVECSEHVPFNAKVAERGTLLILPTLRNRAPLEHLRPMTEGHASRILQLEQDGRDVALLAPPEHQLDRYRAVHPLYDRQLPRLAREIEKIAPGELFIDIGANIGDTVALLRLAGCANPILAVEPSEKFHSFLRVNSTAYQNVELRKAFVGPAGARLALDEHRGTAATLQAAADTAPEGVPTLALGALMDRPTALVKTDTDGFDARVLMSGIDLLKTARPVIWAEAEAKSPAAIEEWNRVIEALADTYGHVIAFDNFGFPVIYGELGTKWPSILDVMDYCRRHGAAPAARAGEPRIYYLDIALFPERLLATYQALLASF
jgi:FkbM family methyltransferase